MGSLEGSQFPPISRNLNEREREQLRISRTQQSMMHTQQLYNTNKNSLTLTTNEWNDDLGDEDNIAGSMAYALSLASSDSFINNEVGSSVKFPSLTRSLSNREMEQLRISQDQLLSMEGLSYRPASYPQLRQQKQQQHNNNSNMLPRTLRDALRPSNEAIVITESSKPFNVFDVNGAWEGLCGYSYAESKGKSLGSLLRGEETDTCTVTALIHQLFVHGEEATAVLTNYTKEGRKFHNRLRVGPIYDEDTGNVSHFVGVLKEVSVTA
jgi:PAS domain S-box-containing protein